MQQEQQEPAVLTFELCCMKCWNAVNFAIVDAVAAAAAAAAAAARLHN
jgi:hypothetical protein